jgi:hypothetical protein
MCDAHYWPCLQAVMRSQTTTTEEDISAPVPEAREPWALPNSIFKARAKEADARAFYDGGAVRGVCARSMHPEQHITSVSKMKVVAAALANCSIAATYSTVCVAVNGR